MGKLLGAIRWVVSLCSHHPQRRGQILSGYPELVIALCFARAREGILRQAAD
jgi:hypothetical protein